VRAVSATPSFRDASANRPFITTVLLSSLRLIRERTRSILNGFVSRGQMFTGAHRGAWR
jgi:hypothetical protein